MTENPKIKKPSIIFTSLGRTGTKYFQVILRGLLPDNTVLHEPDVLNFFQYKGVRNRYQKLIEQVNESGFWNLFILKSLGLWSLIDISDARFIGSCNADRATDQILRQRMNFIESQDGSIFIESNIGYYGILDLLDNVFEHFRAVYLIRDGRDWVRSHMNWGQMYGKGYIQRLFAHTWPTAADLGQMSKENWAGLPQFEKLCWAWGNLNNYSLNCLKENPNIKLFRFEDIFIYPDKNQVLTDLLSFVSEVDHSIDIHSSDGLLDRQIHQSSGEFPAWNNWTRQQIETFLHHCEELSIQQGYKLDF